MKTEELMARLPEIEAQTKELIENYKQSSVKNPEYFRFIAEDVPDLCEAVRILIDALNRFPGSARLSSAPPDLRWINLTSADISAIRRLYDEEKYTESQLCGLFNQNFYVIRNIVRREVWKEIK